MSSENCLDVERYSQSRLYSNTESYSQSQLYSKPESLLENNKNIEQYLSSQNNINLENYLNEQPKLNLENYLSEEPNINLENYLNDDSNTNLENYLNKESNTNLGNYLNKEPDIKNYFNEEPDIKNYLVEDPNIKNYFNEETDIKNYFDEDPNIKNYLNEDPNIKNYLNEEPDIINFLNEESDIKSYLNEEYNTNLENHTNEGTSINIGNYFDSSVQELVEGNDQYISSCDQNNKKLKTQNTGNVYIKHINKWKGNCYLKDDLTFCFDRAHATSFYLSKVGNSTILNGDRVTINSGNKNLVLNSGKLNLIDQISNFPNTFIITDGSENIEPISYDKPIFLITDKNKKTALKYDWKMDTVNNNSGSQIIKPHNYPSLINSTYGTDINFFQFFLENPNNYSQSQYQNLSLQNTKHNRIAQLIREYRGAITITLLMIMLILTIMISK